MASYGPFSSLISSKSPPRFVKVPKTLKPEILEFLRISLLLFFGVIFWELLAGVWL